MRKLYLTERQLGRIVNIISANNASQLNEGIIGDIIGRIPVGKDILHQAADRMEQSIMDFIGTEMDMDDTDENRKKVAHLVDNLIRRKIDDGEVKTIRGITKVFKNALEEFKQNNN